MSETKKRVLITGASQGFGLGAAKALAERGHTVFATMRGIEGKNADTAKEITKWAADGGHALHVLDLDVTSDDSVDNAIKAAVDKADGLDVVINNAGVGTFGLQEAYNPTQVQNLFNINVVGPLRVNRAALPHMRKAGSGHVVFISSGLGRVTMPFLGPYGATKFAVEALADAAAMELAPLGIRATVIQPGAYGTGFGQNSMQPGDPELIESYGPVKQMFEGFVAHFQQMFESGSIGDPQEVVDTYVKVAESDEGPSRVPIGKDMEESVTAVNDVSGKIQKGVRDSLGMS